MANEFPFWVEIDFCFVENSPFLNISLLPISRHSCCSIVKRSLCLNVLSRCIFFTLCFQTIKRYEEIKRNNRSNHHVCMASRMNCSMEMRSIIHQLHLFCCHRPPILSTEWLKIHSDDFTKYMQSAVVRKRSHPFSNGSILISRVDDIAPTMIGPLNSHRNNNSSLPKTFSTNHLRGKHFDLIH